MKAYIVSATIDGVQNFLESDSGMRGMSPCGPFQISTILFLRQTEAFAAIDGLTHGVGKLCRVLEVTIEEPFENLPVSKTLRHMTASEAMTAEEDPLRHPMPAKYAANRPVTVGSVAPFDK